MSMNFGDFGDFGDVLAMPFSPKINQQWRGLQACLGNIGDMARRFSSTTYR